MHGCKRDKNLEDEYKNMIIADLLMPVLSDINGYRIHYRSLPKGGGEKLVIQEDSVTIEEYPSGVVRRRLTADFPLLDAFWCEFPKTSDDDRPLHGVCLIGHKKLIFAPSNDWILYTITLPFTVKRVLRAAIGLVLQRAPPLLSLTPNFPHLFSLSHPYCELLPIICKNKDGDDSPHYLWDNAEILLLEAFNGYPLLLTYSALTQLHSLYWIRKALIPEWKCAASKAESFVSSRASQLSTPRLSCQTKSRSGPNDSFVRLQKRLILSDDTWGTPQSKIARTRSVTSAAALMQSLPFPTTSPAQRSNRSITDSPIIRLRGGSAHVTPRISSFCDDSLISLIETQGSDIDLIAPEICIECIWTESPEADLEACGPASFSFTTEDFTGQLYACFYVAEQSLLKCVRIITHGEQRITASSFVAIACKGAANVEDRRMMAVIDLEGCVNLYSGITRIGSLYGNYEFKFTNSHFQERLENTHGLFLCGPVDEIRPAFVGHIILKSQKPELVLCKLPPVTSSSFVAECFTQLCSSLPQEKAMQVSSLWHTSNSSRLLSNYYNERVATEFAIFLHFILIQCGIYIHDFPVFREVESLRHRSEEGICEKKKRSQHSKHVGIWRNLKKLFNCQWWDFDGSKNAAAKCYHVSINDEGTLYQHSLATFFELHNIYENIKLDRRMNSLLFLLCSSLHAFSGCGSQKMLQILLNTQFLSHLIPSWHDNMVRILKSGGDLALIESSLFVSPIGTIIGIGLKKIRSTVDAKKVLGLCYEQKLGLNEAGTEQFSDILNLNCAAIEKCEKLVQLFKITKSSLLDIPPALAIILCEIFYEPSTKTLRFFTPITCHTDRSVMPTPEELNSITKRRWPRDLRCINVMQMLDSRRPIFLPSSSEALSETNQREMAELLLRSFTLRNVTHAFGRAALNFCSTIPLLNRPYTIPPLNLQGRLHPANAPIELNPTDSVKSLTKWGKFYNAVAAGLSIGNVRNLYLDSEWLSMSITNLQGAEAAGLMYAFGLNGHITNMNLFMIHELLSRGDPLMSIAVLLGCGISRRATSDVQVHKMMITHLPFMMGPTLLELHIDTMIQTAALVGLGLLFAESSHLGIISQLINEIGKPSCSDCEPPAVDRYSYSLAAGFAIGLIGLGRGEDMLSNVPFVKQYPSISSRLVILMQGGLRTLCVFPSNAADLSDVSNVASTTTTSPSNHVRECEFVNPHLTASAATVALGLMYLRTGNRWAAECLKIPETLSSIEKIRPDLITLRTLCKHLVLWNDITATGNWVENSVPSIVLQYKHRLFWTKLNECVSEEESEQSRSLHAAVDKQTIAQAYLSIVAGACLAMAIRFASTWNSEAFNTIWQYIKMVLSVDTLQIRGMFGYAAGTQTCSNVLGILVNALGILMAGSGNLQVLRFCRYLRSRVIMPETPVDHMAHNLHAATSTAIGMLMFGRGRYVLKTDDLSVAALVISFFPVNPHGLFDNRSPLRMLWVIAAEKRLLCTVDSSSEELVELEGSNIVYPDVLTLHTPCVIPELNLLTTVEIGGLEYEKQIFELRYESEVKRLKEILSKQHGRLVVNYLGLKERKLIASTIKQIYDAKDDAMLKPIRLRHLLNAAQKDMELREQFNFSLPELNNLFEDMEKPDETDYSSWIQHFQFDNGSISAYDYAFSFIKDMLRKDSLNFPYSQLRLLDIFTERSQPNKNGDWFITSNVIPKELVLSLT
ncbi:unnamed protein product [Thelazia callipaeda]|uniref:Anaphase-promoting complex subunit 1 n=1 Tax=Thelazia callipaeda TaxID=103827 RepID=A0A0N5D671_THECL|nr:unnamed protein product [Thelazia callipaeda]